MTERNYSESELLFGVACFGGVFGFGVALAGGFGFVRAIGFVIVGFISALFGLALRLRWIAVRGTKAKGDEN